MLVLSEMRCRLDSKVTLLSNKQDEKFAACSSHFGLVYKHSMTLLSSFSISKKMRFWPIHEKLVLKIEFACERRWFAALCPRLCPTISPGFFLWLFNPFVFTHNSKEEKEPQAKRIIMDTFHLSRRPMCCMCIVVNNPCPSVQTQQDWKKWRTETWESQRFPFRDKRKWTFESHF